MKSLSFWLVLWTACCLLSCDSNPTSQAEIVIDPEAQPCLDTTATIEAFFVDSVALTLLYSCNKGGPTLLVLPGWNLPAKDWQTKTHSVDEACTMGYNVLLVEMHKSIYARQFYPETRKDWRDEKTLLWLTDSLISQMQTQHNLFNPKHEHAVVGLSTGGRGAVLVAAERSDLFGFCAALSGDFIPELMPEDNLIKGWYGTYKQFPERWRNQEHPSGRISELKALIYLAHGKKDEIVPVSQTIAFADSLRIHHPNLPLHVFISETGQHDYAFWDSCGNDIISELRSFKKRKHHLLQPNDEL